MLYILRMNITENSSNNHKSTFRIKNFFKKEKNKIIANFSLFQGDFYTEKNIRKLL